MEEPMDLDVKGRKKGSVALRLSQECSGRTSRSLGVITQGRSGAPDPKSRLFHNQRRKRLFFGPRASWFSFRSVPKTVSLTHPNLPFPKCWVFDLNENSLLPPLFYLLSKGYDVLIQKSCFQELISGNTTNRASP